MDTQIVDLPQLSRLRRLLKVDPIAAALGMFGAYLLASGGEFSKWGWVLFLFSNGLWILSGIKVQNRSVIAQYLFYTGNAFYGISNAFFASGSPTIICAQIGL